MLKILTLPQYIVHLPKIGYQKSDLANSDQ